MPDIPTSQAVAHRALPFSIDTQTWGGLSHDVRHLLWEGWSLKLQLDELACGRQHAETVDEARQTGLIKPVGPLTPEQSMKRLSSADARAARLQAAKRAAADKISRLQQQVADENKFGR